MILTVDIGNTNSFFCFFDNVRILYSFKINISEINSRNDLLNCLLRFKKFKEMTGVIISSVVPKLNKLFNDFFIEKVSIKPIFIEQIIDFLNITTFIRDKKSIGSDRVVNVCYAKKKLDSPTLIVDFGTATTIDYINSEDIYEGGVIAPGIDISLRTLNKYTAKLPLINFSMTKKIIGKTTEEAMKSGFYWGYIAMINGLLQKITIEKNIEPTVLLTGGNAKYFKNHIKNSIIDEFFTMKGLNYIYNLKESNDNY